MSGNPFTYEGQNEPDYIYYTIERLKNLKYIDYEVIDDEMRKIGNMKYGEQFDQMEIAEKVETKEEEVDVDEEMVEAHITTTVNMLDRILSADKDAQNLKILTRFSEIWGTFDENIIEPLQ